MIQSMPAPAIGPKLSHHLGQTHLAATVASRRQTIIARLMGGLGNQLFIYAAAVDFARRLNAQLEVDATGGFVRDFKYGRQYLLDQFAITAQSAAPRDCFLGLRGRVLRRCMLKADQLGVAKRRWAFLDETSPVAACEASKIYLNGYWQSEDYFRESAGTVRRELQVRAVLPEPSRAELEAIRAHAEPVAVCIRRGADRPHQEPGLETEANYYHAALQQLVRLRLGSHLFVFTDNADWVRQHLRFPLPSTFVSSKPENRRAYEDLTLMGACRHFVIGNSSFHWWGAWLGERPDSQIYVPQSFAEAKPEFYPARWLRL